MGVDRMSLIERSYDLAAVVAAHRAATWKRGSWRRLSDMEYDAIAGTVLREQREEAVGEVRALLDVRESELGDAGAYGEGYRDALAHIRDDLAKRFGGQ
jgi:hypothetical protein